MVVDAGALIDTGAAAESASGSRALAPAPTAPIDPPRTTDAAAPTRLVSTIVNGQVVIEEVPTDAPPGPSPDGARAPSDATSNASPAALSSASTTSCVAQRSELDAMLKSQAAPPNMSARSKELLAQCPKDELVRRARARVLFLEADASSDPARKQELLTEAVDFDPRNAAFLEELGDAADNNNQLRAAIDAYRRAVDLNWRYARPKLDDAERRLRVEGGFDKRANQYFVARFEGAERKELADAVLDHLEDAREQVGEKLGLYPSQPINVVIYTGDQYARALDAPDWSGGQFDGQIRVREGDVKAARGTLRDLLFHEYVHAVLRLAVKDRVPAWMHEGLAQRLEPGFDRASELGPLQGKKEPELPQLKQLEWGWSNETDRKQVSLNYACALDLVDELERWRGERSFASLFESINKGKKFYEALDDVYSLDRSLLERRWRDRYK